MLPHAMLLTILFISDSYFYKNKKVQLIMGTF